jgi:hypothetical protein
MEIRGTCVENHDFSHFPMVRPGWNWRSSRWSVHV